MVSRVTSIPSVLVAILLLWPPQNKVQLLSAVWLCDKAQD